MDWNSQDIQRQGYYYAIFESVEINCYDADKAPGTNKGKSYTFNDERGTNDTVVDGNKGTVLKSLQGTGTDMEKGDPAKSAGGSASTSKVPESIPGLSGAGVGAQDHGGDSAAQSSGASTPQATQDGSGTADNGVGGNTFSQGSGANAQQNTNTGGAERLGSQETALKGSFFAVVVAVFAMMAL